MSELRSSAPPREREENDASRLAATAPEYLNDAYTAELNATVVMRDEGAARVALDRTPFYPGGGGQPPDTGTLRWGGFTAQVTGAKREGQLIWHTLAGDDLPAVGETVTAALDWDRRYLIMRTHSAMHVLCGVMWEDRQARVTGHNLGPGEGRCDFEVPSVAGDFKQHVEQRINDEIARGLPIQTAWVSRSEADRDDALIRAKADLIPRSIDPLRVIEIAGLDRQADSGTHVRSTLEIGSVRVTKTESRGAINKRIRIALDD
jgi:misacylated tRNA(Ala) deacylase